MVSQESAVKKYIVTLSDAERKQLTALSQDGAAWSDGQIAAALETVPIRSPGRANGWSKKGWRLR